MAAIDAQFYWMSAKVPNDDFMLYAFDGEPAELERAVEQVLRRARACPELGLRVDDGSALTYPRWVPAAVGPEYVACHDLADHTWHGCLTALPGLADNQLDIRRMPWRLHVFTPVLGIPGVAGPGTVAVMQVPHAVADGVRSAAMAAWLFGRDVPVPEVGTATGGLLPVAGLRCRPRPSPAGSRSPHRAAAARGVGCGRRWRPTPDRTAPARCARWYDTVRN